MYRSAPTNCRKRVNLIESYLGLPPQNKMSQEYENWSGGPALTIALGRIIRNAQIYPSAHLDVGQLSAVDYNTKLNIKHRTPVLINKIKVSVVNVATYLCLMLSNHRLHKQCRKQIAHLRQQCHISKCVTFQERLLKVLKCYNFL